MSIARIDLCILDRSVFHVLLARALRHQRQRDKICHQSIGRRSCWQPRIFALDCDYDYSHHHKSPISKRWKNIEAILPSPRGGGGGPTTAALKKKVFFFFGRKMTFLHDCCLHGFNFWSSLGLALTALGCFVRSLS